MANETIAEQSLLEAPSKVDYIIDLIKPIFSKIVVALIILLIGFIIGKFFQKIIHKILREVELNNLAKRTVGLRLKLEEFISHAISYFIYFIAIIMAMEIMNLSSIIIYIMSAGLIIIIISSILLGIKDFIPNFFAGLTLHRKKFLNEGDMIEIDNIKGKVIDFNLIDVQLETNKGDMIFVPNAIFIKKEFKRLKK